MDDLEGGVGPGPRRHHLRRVHHLQEALLTADTLDERHASENKDKDLQALIYVQQIDRLKKRIIELEGR